MLCKEAAEPTNIIWEHRHYTRKDRLARGCGVFVISFILICISFVIITLFQLKSIEVAATYPDVDCAELDDQYEDTMEIFALKEYV